MSGPRKTGRHKKAQNVVKVDLGDYAFGTGEILPVRVQHSSKDGRRIEQSIHRFPTPRLDTPQLDTPQLDPPPPSFDPFLVLEDNQDCALPEFRDPTDGSSGPERVSPRLPCQSAF